jgi:predicted nucleotidyltransferase
MEGIMDFLNHHINQIKDLCSQYKVKRLFAFGSVLTDRFNEQSDVDLLEEQRKFIVCI